MSYSVNWQAFVTRFTPYIDSEISRVVNHNTFFCYLTN